MRRLILAALLTTTACSSAAIGTSTTLPPPITTTTTSIPIGPGQCGRPLLTDERIPDGQLADEIISRFVNDRLAGEGAEGCLTNDAAQTYAASAFPACLYSCTDLAVLKLPDHPTITPAGDTALGPERSILVTYQVGDTLTRIMREVYTIQTVRAPDETRQILIGSVAVEPESQVDEVHGRQVIGDLLASLADGAWDVAEGLLINAGASDAIVQRLPGLWESPADEVLAPFCETALCTAPYEIVGSQATSALTRSYQVRFTSSDGPVTIDMPVNMLGGQLTVGDLPPDGTTDETHSSLKDLLFPDGYDGQLALLRYSSIQVAGDTPAWYLWPSARNALDSQVIAGHVLFDGFGGVRLATLGEGSVDINDVIAAGAWTLAGVAMDEDEPVALVTDGRRLVVYRISDAVLRAIVDMDPSEGSISCASVGNGTILVSSRSGDATSYDLYSFADGSPLAHFDPDKAAGCAVLSPDGSTFVYSADVSLGNPQTIVLASATDGAEIDRWSVLADAVIGSPIRSALVFDGRYAVADLAVPPEEAPYVQNEDLGRRLVVDTQTGDQWTVDTSSQILFPPG
jgi:hypothetical protein